MELAFRCIQWHNNVDHCIGCHVGHLLLCDKDDANQWLHKACAGGPLHVQTSVVRRTWCHCCFSCPPRLTFGTRVNSCDDFGHKRGFHLVALWAFKIGGNQCQHDLSLSQWVLSPLAIGSMSNLTRRRFCWCSMHTTMWIYTSFYTLWKRIESFNEYYLIFYWMLLLLLSKVNTTTIFLMASLNAINGKSRWLS